MATTPFLATSFTKSPNCVKIVNPSWPFLGSPLATIKIIFPANFVGSFDSSSRLKTLAATSSPSAPAAGVDPVQPMASKIPQQFRNTQDRGQWIVQFVGPSGNHLPHGGKAFGLDQLLLKPLLLGNVAHRSDNA